LETGNRSPIVILGCGESINSLSSAEKGFLNRCEALLGLNKFTAFSDLAGIVPTHVFFVDSFSLATDVYLQATFDLCRQTGMKGVTFILNEEAGEGRRDFKRDFKRRRIGGAPVLVERRSAGMCMGLRQCAAAIARKYRALRKDPHPVRKLAGSMRRQAGRIPWLENPSPMADSELEGRVRAFVLPPSCNYQYVTHTNWWKPEKDWATSLSQPLYHHRGSLTSAINYAAIVWPGRDILLVGTDFYSAEYFFEDSERYKKLQIPDWTHEIVRSAGKHFSAIEHQGTTMFDSFDFMNKKLKESGNHMYCANKKSLLVENGCVPFREIPSS
jgi:hypothetical protein